MSSHSNSPLGDAAAPPGSPPVSPLPNFMQMRSFLPSWAWRVLRGCSVSGALAVAALLVWRPDQGLPLFWGLIVPALPLAFMLTPGIWRNVCPLATSNQAPRRLGLIDKLATRFKSKFTQRSLSTGAAFPIGIGLFVAAILTRKLMFNSSGPATAALIVGAMVAAFAGGILFKGKSGWCSSICPLLPVQRLYGQTPFIKVANTQCEPCVGCAKNCYDFSPEEAYLADQYDVDPHYREFRRFFAGVFPGLILGFYLVPGAQVIGAVNVVLQMLSYMAGSLSVFVLLDLLFRATPNRMPVVFAALAINIYYWFVAPVVLDTLQHLGVPIGDTMVGALRALVAVASLVWVGRSIQAEKMYLKEQVRKGQGGEINLPPVVVQTVRIHRNIVQRRDQGDAVARELAAANSARIQGGDTAPGALGPAEIASASFAPTAAAAAAGSVATLRPAPSGASAARQSATAPAIASSRPGLRIHPEGRCVPLKTGTSVLSALESCGAAIQAGCRAGACGADPIAITDGADCLSPVNDVENATLQRLGHASNTRMACMARMRRAGTVTIELKPHAAGGDSAAQPAGVPMQPAVAAPIPEFDRSIRSVVIIGNGVAGLTAAETVRRHHPECEVHLVSRERYQPYNRIAVSALINQRSGLHGMGLKPEAWYTEQRVTQWLNTRATRIDTTDRSVHLATGETLRYDRLIVANGSQAWAPPVENFGAEGTFVLRQASDAMAIRDYAQRRSARRAVVVGAGLLGLEAAAELQKFGMQVSVLSLNDMVLDRQIDATASAIVVAHLRQQGIELVRNATLSKLKLDDGRLRGMSLADGRELQADLLVVCAGTRAEVDLARDAGLTIGRGITVDAQMRTSVPHVYAAGDVAEFEGQQFGLWSIAISQGEVAARSALGLDAMYEPIQPVTSLKMKGIEVRSAGLANADGAGLMGLLCAGPNGEPLQDEEEDDDEGVRYCKLIVERRVGNEADARLVGAVIVGSHEVADELLDAVRRRATLKSLRRVLDGHRWLRQSVVTPLSSAIGAAGAAGIQRAKVERVA
ncbi:hypothetical protein BH09PSE5_BH09PSE5_22620 [soil metagenome]